MGFQLNILSSALNAGAFQEHDPEVLTLQMLGPIIDDTTLDNIEHTFAQVGRGRIYVAGFLLRPAYEIIRSQFGRQEALTQLQEYLRPISCSLTELRVESQHLESLPHSHELQDQVIRRYVENIIWDLKTHLQREVPRASVAVRGLYYSQTQERLLFCKPRRRALTPAFGCPRLMPRSELCSPQSDDRPILL